MQETFDEIKEINLFYLLLAQKMLREDYSLALFRLGISPQVAEKLLKFSQRQLMQISDSSMLLCRFRLDEAELLSALVEEDVTGGGLRRARLAIKLAEKSPGARP